jgi:hypothetical protein
MSGLYGAWGNTSHSYLPGKSVTTFPKCGRALSCKMSGPPPNKSSQVCMHFSAKFLHPVTIVRCCQTCSTWNSICHDDSSVIISKNHDLLDRWLHSSKLFGSQESWTSPLVWLRFQLRFTVFNPRFLNSVISIQECFTFNLNLCFSNVAISRRFCFCSAVKQRGTHRAQIVLICKSFVKIRNTDVGKNQVACDTCISSHVVRWFCGSKSATSFTLRSSVDVFCLPDLW